MLQHARCSAVREEAKRRLDMVVLAPRLDLVAVVLTVHPDVCDALAVDSVLSRLLPLESSEHRCCSLVFAREDELPPSEVVGDDHGVDDAYDPRRDVLPPPLVNVPVFSSPGLGTHSEGATSRFCQTLVGKTSSHACAVRAGEALDEKELDGEEPPGTRALFSALGGDSELLDSALRPYRKGEGARRAAGPLRGRGRPPQAVLAEKIFARLDGERRPSAAGGDGGCGRGHRSGEVRVPDWAFHGGGPAGGGRGRPGGPGSADLGCGSSPRASLSDQHPPGCIPSLLPCVHALLRAGSAAPACVLRCSRLHPGHEDALCPRGRK